MRKLLVAVTAIAVLGMLSGPALAGKGGGGNGANAETPPSIDLCEVDGVAVNGCATEAARLAAPRPHLGGTVSFAVSYPKLPGNTNARIQVICYQDGALVYGEAYSADRSFLLGGSWSEWLENGGAASCQADLYYWDYKGPNQRFVGLASIAFEADGQTA